MANNIPSVEEFNYKNPVTGWSRNTVADGQFLNDVTIQPLFHRDEELLRLISANEGAIYKGGENISVNPDTHTISVSGKKQLSLGEGLAKWNTEDGRVVLGINQDLLNEIHWKKWMQEPYEQYGSTMKTITGVHQDENGRINVVYDDIVFPSAVPNVEIYSPYDTLSISAWTDPETSARMFGIDVDIEKNENWYKTYDAADGVTIADTDEHRLCVFDRNDDPAGHAGSNIRWNADEKCFKLERGTYFYSVRTRIVTDTVSDEKKVIRLLAGDGEYSVLDVSDIIDTALTVEGALNVDTDVVDFPIVVSSDTPLPFNVRIVDISIFKINGTTIASSKSSVVHGTNFVGDGTDENPLELSDSLLIGHESDAHASQLIFDDDRFVNYFYDNTSGREIQSETVLDQYGICYSNQTTNAAGKDAYGSVIDTFFNVNESDVVFSKSINGHVTENISLKNIQREAMNSTITTNMDINLAKKASAPVSNMLASAGERNTCVASLFNVIKPHVLTHDTEVGIYAGSGCPGTSALPVMIGLLEYDGNYFNPVEKKYTNTIRWIADTGPIFTPMSAGMNTFTLRNITENHSESGYSGDATWKSEWGPILRSDRQYYLAFFAAGGKNSDEWKLLCNDGYAMPMGGEPKLTWYNADLKWSENPLADIPAWVDISTWGVYSPENPGEWATHSAAFSLSAINWMDEYGGEMYPESCDSDRLFVRIGNRQK